MRIFLAGADNSHHTTAGAVSGAGCFLTSYYHSIYGKINSSEVRRMAQLYHHLTNRGADWIMDSGLFTMMFGSGKGKTYAKSDLLKYTDRYIGDMETIGFRHTIVEMDVHKVLGMSEVAEFRAKFESRWGIERTMFVFHLEETIDGLRSMARRYPYIALSIPELRLNRHRIGGNLRSAIQRLVGTALEENPNVKIHLLGCTQPSLMELEGVWSADSSSWLQGNSFARTLIFHLGKIRSVHRRSQLAQDEIAKRKPGFLVRWRQLERQSGIKCKLDWYRASLAFNAGSFVALNRYLRARFYNNAPLPTVIGLETTQ